MASKHSKIQEFRLSDEAKGGVYIVNMKDLITADSHDTSRPHRDNHYIFMLATHGRYLLNLDFNYITINSPALVMVVPGQVHHMLEVQEPAGWIVNFDPSVIGIDLQQLLENSLVPILDLKGELQLENQLSSLLMLVNDMLSMPGNIYTSKSVHALLFTFCGFIAGKLLSDNVEQRATAGRSYEIKQSFIALLRKHYKEWKEPAKYAEALSISVAYLNACVKSLTDTSVSTHIQQYNMLEAKRLLYYTNLTSKEIGYQLGYNEPVYFGKLFRKHIGLTPLEFRHKFVSGEADTL